MLQGVVRMCTNHKRSLMPSVRLHALPDVSLGRRCCLCAQVIELPIKHPELFESLGVAQPKARQAQPS